MRARALSHAARRSCALLGLLAAALLATPAAARVPGAANAGLATMMAGQASLATAEPFVFPAQAFTISFEVRSLRQDAYMHPIMFVINPVEMQTGSCAGDVAEFGDIAPEKEFVQVALVNYESATLELFGTSIDFGVRLFTDTEWHHITITFSRALATASLYVDEALASSVTYDAASLAAFDASDAFHTPGHMFFGRERWITKTFAKVDDLRLFNVSLTAEEVYIMVVGRNAPPAHLGDMIYEYRLDESSIAAINDTSFNGRHGTAFFREEIGDHLTGLRTRYTQFNSTTRCEHFQVSKVPSAAHGARWGANLMDRRFPCNATHPLSVEDELNFCRPAIAGDRATFSSVVYGELDSLSLILWGPHVCGCSKLNATLHNCYDGSSDVGELYMLLGSETERAIAMAEASSTPDMSVFNLSDPSVAVNLEEGDMVQIDPGQIIALVFKNKGLQSIPDPVTGAIQASEFATLHWDFATDTWSTHAHINLYPNTPPFISNISVNLAEDNSFAVRLTVGETFSAGAGSAATSDQIVDAEGDEVRVVVLGASPAITGIASETSVASSFLCRFNESMRTELSQLFNNSQCLTQSSFPETLSAASGGFVVIRAPENVVGKDILRVRFMLVDSADARSSEAELRVSLTSVYDAAVPGEECTGLNHSETLASASHARELRRTPLSPEVRARFRTVEDDYAVSLELTRGRRSARSSDGRAQTAPNLQGLHTFVAAEHVIDLSTTDVLIEVTDEESEAAVEDKCSSLCTPLRVPGVEGSSVDFKLPAFSFEGRSPFIDLVVLPRHGKLFQLVMSPQHPDPRTAPTRLLSLTDNQGILVTQWASSARASSAWGGFEHNVGWSIFRLLGPPDVYPSYGNFAGAWSASGFNERDWIEIEFPTAVYPTGIDIYQVWSGGRITAVSLKHPDGGWVVAWRQDPAERNANIAAELGRATIFQPPICMPAFATRTIRIDVYATFDEIAAGWWPEFDAVLLRGYRLPPARRLLHTLGTTRIPPYVPVYPGAEVPLGVDPVEEALARASGRNRTTTAEYWLRYVPDDDFEGEDSFVYSTTDCTLDSTRSSQLDPCRETVLEVAGLVDPPDMLVPWSFRADQLVALAEGAERVNASVMVVSFNREVLASASPTPSASPNPSASPSTATVVGTPSSTPSPSPSPSPITRVLLTPEFDSFDHQWSVAGKVTSKECRGGLTSFVNRRVFHAYEVLANTFNQHPADDPVIVANRRRRTTVVGALNDVVTTNGTGSSQQDDDRFTHEEILAAFDTCGATVLLRGSDVDFFRGEQLSFGVVRPPRYGTLFLSATLPTSIGVDLLVDAAQALQVLLEGSTSLNTLEEVRALCQSLEDAVLVSEASISARGERGARGLTVTMGEGDSVEPVDLGARLSDEDGDPRRASNPLGRRVMSRRGGVVQGRSFVLSPAIQTLRERSARGLVAARVESQSAIGVAAPTHRGRSESLRPKLRVPRQLADDETPTLASLGVSASVATYVPEDDGCGIGFDEFWIVAFHNDSREIEFSHAVRMSVDVMCEPGTRRFLELQRVSLQVVASLVLAFAVAVTAWFASLAHSSPSPIITAAQPWFTVVLGFGPLLLCLDVLVEVSAPRVTIPLCKTHFVLYSYGLATILAVLFAKVYRVFRLLIRIHINPTLKRVDFPTRYLFYILALVLVCVGVYLIALTTVSPVSLVEVADARDEAVTHLKCSGPYYSLFSLSAQASTALVILAAAYLAFMTRNVNSQHGESRAFGAAVAGTVAYLVTQFVISMATGDDVQLNDSLTHGASLMVAFTIMFLVPFRRALAATRPRLHTLIFECPCLAARAADERDDRSERSTHAAGTSSTSGAAPGGSGGGSSGALSSSGVAGSGGSGGLGGSGGSGPRAMGRAPPSPGADEGVRVRPFLTNSAMSSMLTGDRGSTGAVVDADGSRTIRGHGTPSPHATTRTTGMLGAATAGVSDVPGELALDSLDQLQQQQRQYQPEGTRAFDLGTTSVAYVLGGDEDRGAVGGGKREASRVKGAEVAVLLDHTAISDRLAAPRSTQSRYIRSYALASSAPSTAISVAGSLSSVTAGGAFGGHSATTGWASAAASSAPRVSGPTMGPTSGVRESAVGAAAAVAAGAAVGGMASHARIRSAGVDEESFMGGFSIDSNRGSSSIAASAPVTPLPPGSAPGVLLSSTAGHRPVVLPMLGAAGTDVGAAFTPSASVDLTKSNSPAAKWIEETTNDHHTSSPDGFGRGVQREVVEVSHAGIHDSSQGSSLVLGANAPSSTTVLAADVGVMMGVAAGTGSVSVVSSLALDHSLAGSPPPSAGPGRRVLGGGGPGGVFGGRGGAFGEGEIDPSIAGKRTGGEAADVEPAMPPGMIAESPVGRLPRESTPSPTQSSRIRGRQVYEGVDAREETDGRAGQGSNAHGGDHAMLASAVGLAALPRLPPVPAPGSRGGERVSPSVVSEAGSGRGQALVAGGSGGDPWAEGSAEGPSRRGGPILPPITLSSAVDTGASAPVISPAAGKPTRGSTGSNGSGSSSSQSRAGRGDDGIPA